MDDGLAERAGLRTRQDRLVATYFRQGRPMRSVILMLRQTGGPPLAAPNPKILAPNDRRKVPRG